jgi:hypothetical protein
VIIIFEYFVLGMLFTSFVFPLCDGILSLLLTFIEMLKGYLSVKITKMNCQIQKATEPEADVKRKIGFVLPENEEDVDV